jgi:hypothetical protein
MPQLNANEKRLLTVMGVAVFIIANFFGWMMISSAMDGISTEEKKLNVSLKTLQKAKLSAAEASVKQDWIDKNVRTYPSEEARETYLSELVQGPLISGLDIEVLKNNPLTTIPGEYFIKSRYKFNAKGPWNDVMELIFRLQKPTDLRFVPRIQLLPKKGEVDDTQQYVEASLELEQWWAKPEGMTTEETAPEVEQPATETVSPSATDAPKPAESPDAAKPPVPPPAPVPPVSTPVPAPAPAPTDSPKPNP